MFIPHVLSSPRIMDNKSPKHIIVLKIPFLVDINATCMAQRIRFISLLMVLPPMQMTVNSLKTAGGFLYFPSLLLRSWQKYWQIYET